MRQLPTYLETAGLPCFPKLPTYLTYHTGRRFRRAYVPTSELTRRTVRNEARFCKALGGTTTPAGKGTLRSSHSLSQFIASASLGRSKDESATEQRTSNKLRRRAAVEDARASCWWPGYPLTYLPTYLPPHGGPVTFYLPTFDVSVYRAT